MMFDFGDSKKHEEIMHSTWEEFRNALANRKFEYTDIDAALKETFLKVFNDMFEVNRRKSKYTKTFKELRESAIFLARGANLPDSNPVDYERFIPKSEYIKDDNRFSPPGVEWLYIAMGKTKNIAEECTIKECKAKSGQNFAICQFAVDEEFDDLKIVDLSIADEMDYKDINELLESFGQRYKKNVIQASLKKGYPVKMDEELIKENIMMWATNMYARLMSKSLFEPVPVEDKKLMYTPFQCLAQYFRKCGFDGIIYSSTVYPEAKDIVFFDKKYAEPFGKIQYKVIS